MAYKNCFVVEEPHNTRSKDPEEKNNRTLIVRQKPMLEITGFPRFDSLVQEKRRRLTKQPKRYLSIDHVDLGSLHNFH